MGVMVVVLVYLQSATSAYESVLRSVGTFWWNRTPLEARIVNEVRTNGGKVIKSGTEVCSIAGYEYPATSGGSLYTEPAGTDGQTIATFDGLPLFPAVNRPSDFDTDGDGMPDAWEIAHGLDPNTPDQNGDFDSDGYTNVEEYLNELAAFPAPKALSFNPSGGRYALCSNWDLNWQPSRYDTALIQSGTAIVDSAGQHAGTLIVGGSAGLPVELLIRGGWLQVESTLLIGGTAGPGCLLLNGGSLTSGTGGLVISSNATLLGTSPITAPSALINGEHTPDFGTQTFSGALSYGATSHLHWALNQNATSGSGAMTIQAGGTVQITNGAIVDLALNASGSQVDFSTDFWLQNQQWPLITGSTVTGNFLLGTVTTDAAGHSASSYGAFSVEQTAEAILIRWTSAYQTWKAA